jgi:hypothetical protein
MSRDISFADVLVGLDHYGTATTVVTVTEAGAPHVTTSLVAAVDEQLVIGVGARSREHLTLRPTLTLVWHPRSGDYQMILDGEATAIGAPDEGGVSVVTVSIHRGILHRMADASSTGAMCRAVATAASIDPDERTTRL